MKHLLIVIILAFVFINCAEDFGTAPEAVHDTVYVAPVNTFKASDILDGGITTWIEVEYNLPQDTTWWTLCADGTMYAAWKRKVYSTTFAWQPWIKDTAILIGEEYKFIRDTVKNRQNIPVNRNGLTLREYSEIYTDISTTWLPIQYQKGGWGLSRSGLMTLTPRVIKPGNAMGVDSFPYKYECDLVNCTWVETQLFFCYIKWEHSSSDTLQGYQAYETGNVMSVKDNDPNVIFIKWNGKHLNDITNPIFLQL